MTVLKKDNSAYEKEKKFQLEVSNDSGICYNYLEEFDSFMWIFLNTHPAWE